MIGVTIGIGKGWQELATAAARRMEDWAGLPCVVIDQDTIGCAHPSWLKCHIPAMFPHDDEFLVFDADILCVREWDPAALFETLGRPFMAVPEPGTNPEVMEECRKWQLAFPDSYLNCGLLIFGREHAPVLDATWAYHPHGGAWLEQSALNRSLVDSGVEICRLPRRYNTLAKHGRINSIYARVSPRDAVCLHTCAMSDPAEILAHHQRLGTWFASGLAGRDRFDWLQTLPTGSVGAEIGVFRGDFSRQILDVVQPSTLHLVDIFEGIVMSGDEHGRHLREEDLSTMPEALAALSPVVQVQRSDSAAWLLAQPAASLDWVYIDAAHDHDRVLADLRAASHAVKPGGIIAGHDFSRAFPGVMEAVLTFLAENKGSIDIYDGDLLPSYAIRNAKGMTRGLAALEPESTNQLDG